MPHPESRKEASVLPSLQPACLPPLPRPVQPFPVELLQSEGEKGCGSLVCVSPGQGGAFLDGSFRTPCLLFQKGVLSFLAPGVRSGTNSDFC